MIAERRPGVLVVAAARPDTLRTLYGHWTAVVRRSRTGLLMAGCSDVDGDLLGELLPRTPPIPARPGLAWVVSSGGRSLAQVRASRMRDVMLVTCRSRWRWRKASRQESLRLCSTERS